MLKKTAILGLVFLLAGGSLLGWVFIERAKDRQLLQQRREKEKKDINKISEVVAGEIDVSRFGDSFYSQTPNDSDDAKKREEKRGLALTLSGIFTLTGGTLVGWFVLLGIARVVVGGFRGASGLFGASATRSKEKASEGTELAEPDSAENKSASATPRIHKKTFKTIQPAILADSGKPAKSQSGFALARWRERGEKNTKKAKLALSKTDRTRRFGGQGEKHSHEQEATGAGSPPAQDATPPQTEGEAPSLKMKKRSAPADASAGSQRLSKGQIEDAGPQTEPTASAENTTNIEDSFKAQTEDLEKRMEEFRRITQSLQLNAVEQSKPVRESLQALAEQVSAIREYASHQQERVKKLQEGYDWNIIKNFCLRVIRCIDNIESRISRLAEGNIDVSAIEEIRDELVFALESTGVDQFQPEINSDYRGQERNTEVVKERESCSDPGMAGKIAKVIRPGYQYSIDEDNVKIVRTAQVKVYG